MVVVEMLLMIKIYETNKYQQYQQLVKENHTKLLG